MRGILLIPLITLAGLSPLSLLPDRIFAKIPHLLRILAGAGALIVAGYALTGFLGGFEAFGSGVDWVSRLFSAIVGLAAFRGTRRVFPPIPSSASL